MKLSTRGRYATRALLDLAMHADEGPVSLKEISARQEISPKYLDQILAQLRNAGIVRAIRGSKGGFILSSDPATLTLLDILNVMEGRTAVVDCVLDPGLCAHADECVTRKAWTEVTEAIDEVLSRITLASLIEKTKKPGAWPCPR